MDIDGIFGLEHLQFLDMSNSIVDARLDITLNSVLEVLLLSSLSVVTQQNRLTVSCNNDISHLVNLDISSVKFNIAVSIKNCTFPCINRLKASNTKIEISVAQLSNENIFQTMSQLEYLDLTNTSLTSETLLSDLFSKLVNIRQLKLGPNNITLFPITIIPNMNMLELLDLSYNKLSCISFLTLRNLNDIQKRTHNVSLDWTGNNLICSCTCIPFLTWLTTSQVHMVNQIPHPITCVFG